eukprot:GHVR01188492.1.p1 GENE.GHVR01188492.1~~GHVR01188492.1.p1  ORF type:complete len:155 (+),score=18.78 GHVR01188492.1:479-943(+)
MVAPYPMPRKYSQTGSTHAGFSKKGQTHSRTMNLGLSTQQSWIVENDLAPGIPVSVAMTNPTESLARESSRDHIRPHVLAPSCPLLDRVTLRRTGAVAVVRRVVSIDGGAVHVTCPGGGGPNGLGRDGEPSNATRQIGVRPRLLLSHWVLRNPG